MTFETSTKSVKGVLFHDFLLIHDEVSPGQAYASR